MRRHASDYAAAAVFLVLFAIGGLVTTLLSPGESAALRLWASTNVASLQHHPVPALVLSAFLPSGSPFAWLAPIALMMFLRGRLRDRRRGHVRDLANPGHGAGCLRCPGIRQPHLRRPDQPSRSRRRSPVRDRDGDRAGPRAGRQAARREGGSGRDDVGSRRCDAAGASVPAVRPARRLTTMTTDEERADRGTRVRREVLGDAHVDRATASTTGFTARSRTSQYAGQSPP